MFNASYTAATLGISILAITLLAKAQNSQEVDNNLETNGKKQGDFHVYAFKQTGRSMRYQGQYPLIGFPLPFAINRDGHWGLIFGSTTHRSI